MPKWKYYNPEGMQDKLFDRCYIKRNLESKIIQVFRNNGFYEIDTPAIEFYDVFSNDRQIIAPESLFKFVDKKGRLLALRPELTIPAARVVGTKLKDMSLPIKISYLGNCYQYTDAGPGQQREFTQAGVEIFASNNPFYDAQIIKMAIETIKQAGIEEFTIELGQVEFFKGLMEQTMFDEETIELIRTMIEAKDYFGVEELLDDREVKASIKEKILNMSSYLCDKKTLLILQKSDLNTRSKNAITNLLNILDILEQFGLTSYISVDLGMVKKLNYYTGMIFKGLTYGLGYPILSGGRYDNLSERYGKPLCATGFSVGIDSLLNALQRQDKKSEKPSVDTIVMFSVKGRNSAINITKQLKEQGLSVDLVDDSITKEYAIKRNVPGIIHVLDDENIKIINIQEDTTINTTIEQLLKGETS
ncbi:MAG: ATP phosphoribosyltransferase regulatory subunit [Clostridiales bacterium]|nr:ATP phosphoribosyltransferase regulatory subunit [Clostridiales bacterium]